MKNDLLQNIYSLSDLINYYDRWYPEIHLFSITKCFLNCRPTKKIVSVSRIWSHSTFNHVWTIPEVCWCFQGRQRATVYVNGLDHIFHYISDNFCLPIYLTDSYKDHHSAWNYQCVTSKGKSWWRWSANRLQVYDPMFERHTPYILSCVQQIWNGMQSRIKNPVKHLKFVNYFCKTLHLRCLTTF